VIHETAAVVSDLADGKAVAAAAMVGIAGIVLILVLQRWLPKVPAVLDEELNRRGISLVFAELKDPVRAKIERYGLTRTIDPGHFFPTVGAAVCAFQAESTMPLESPLEG
jgi:MFS superfamily sulfate permease-like transporter